MDSNTIMQTENSDQRSVGQKFQGFFKNISSVRQILLWYIIISLTGAFLLYLPFTHKASFNEAEGMFGVSLIDAIFVSSSAFSDTGLSPLGISDTFNFFGQLVTLILLQVGGVGWFTIKIFILTFILRKATSYNSIADGSSELGTANKNDTLGLVFAAVIISFAASIIGGFIFSLIFYFTDVDGINNYWQALWTGYYHATTSVNNSGLDIFSANDSMATLYQSSESLTYYATNPFTGEVIEVSDISGVKVGWEILIEALTMFLFILGGMGFGIFYDLYKWSSHKYSGERFHFSLITKLCIVTYVSVAFAGLGLVYLSEGLATLGDSTGSFLSNDWLGSNEFGVLLMADSKLLAELNAQWHSAGGTITEFLSTLNINEVGAMYENAVKSSATFVNTSSAFRWWTITFNTFSTRNAGFASMNLAYLHDVTKLIFSMMMFIGSGPGSTAGGLRTTTFAVIIVTLWATSRNKPQPHAFGKGFPQEVTRKAFAILCLSLIIVLGNVIIISITEIALGHTTNSFIDNMFVVFSAYGTTGLAIADLSTYHWISKLALIIVMFIGQMGISNTINQVKSKQIRHQLKFVEEHINLG